MHSSRMRTGRSLTVCCCLLPGGGSAWSGGVLPWGGGRGCLPGPGGGSARSGGILPAGWVSAWSGGFVAAGNDYYVTVRRGPSVARYNHVHR